MWAWTIKWNIKDRGGVLMLDIKNLTIRLKESGFTLVDRLTFTVKPGDKIALIGQEGTGKTTLLDCLTDVEAPFHVEMKGDIRKKGVIGRLEQDITERYAKTRTLDFFVKDDPRQEPLPERYEMLKNLREVLNRLGFPMEAYHDDKRIGDYSGGEAVKLGIARLLMRDVEILLLDEPTNDLDFETILFLEDFIREEERPILFVSHDERLLENTANGVIYLQRIRKRKKAMTDCWRGTFKEFADQRLRRFESDLMIAKKQRAEYKKKMERFRQIYQKVAHEQDQTVRNPEKARLLKKKIKHLKSIEKNIEREKEDFKEIPEPEEPIDIAFSESVTLPAGRRVGDFHIDKLEIDGRKLSRDIRLVVRGPMKVAITGANGSGKTTLLKALRDSLSEKENLRVGYMPQDHKELENESTVLTFLGVADRRTEGRVRKMLGALGFEREEMVVPVFSLSGGQKTKLCLLRMILEERNVLLLDEPTRNLSPLSAPRVRSVLSGFQGAIIAVTHDRAFIEEVFDEMYRLDSQGLHRI